MSPLLEAIALSKRNVEVSKTDCELYKPIVL